MTSVELEVMIRPLAIQSETGKEIVIVTVIASPHDEDAPGLDFDCVVDEQIALRAGRRTAHQDALRTALQGIADLLIREGFGR